MKNRKPHLIAALAIVAALGGATFLFDGSNSRPSNDTVSFGHGDIATLKAAFDAWRQTYETRGGSANILKLNLGYSKALSTLPTKGRGALEFNLFDGNLTLRTAGLDDGAYDLWLVDDGTDPRNTVKPEATDRFVRLGGFSVKRGQGSFADRVRRDQLRGLTMDSVVVTATGKTPVEQVVITGGPDLMQKIYYSNQPWKIAEVGDIARHGDKTGAPFTFLLPRVAVADTVSDLSPVLGAQVAFGRQVFHKETFNGNGRTCGTCHREDNNFTIDPNYIAKLPSSDKLFVAETDPNLSGLENPALLRKYGLILTSVDGAGSEVFRSVPHTLSLGTTIVSESRDPLKLTPNTPFVEGEFKSDDAFAHATGWSGDGAPGTGSLNEFALGAVIQHMPKTFNRNFNDQDNIPDDGRLPTSAELDAIEAYTLSLGRSKDYPVWKLSFSDPLTQAGKVLFDTKQNPCTHNTAQSGNPAVCPPGETVVQGTTANCNGCHQHAGGRSSTTFANPSRNTGVESFKINPARLIHPSMPYDGGLGGAEKPVCGTNADQACERTNCGPNADQACVGDGRFNTPPLIEAADTGPFFHNNSVSTLEESIAAYNSDAFNNSPGALTSKLADRHVKLDSTQVTAVASFLRAINALENIRLSNRLDNQAKQVTNNARARELSRLALEENQDAIQVLKDGIVLGGYAPAIKKLESASYYQSLALIAPGQTLRNTLIQQAIAKKTEARNLIATCDENAARPSSVGASPEGFVYTCGELSAL